MARVFEIKNRYLIGLVSWLQGLSLEGKKSRDRTRFCNLMKVRLEENVKFHRELLEKYVKKDKDKKWKKIKEGNTEVWDIPKDKADDFSKEYNELYDEVFKTDITTATKGMFKRVREVVLETNYKFGPKSDDTGDQRALKMQEAENYNYWCESFEAIEL